MNVKLVQFQEKIKDITANLMKEGKRPDPREIAAIARSMLSQLGEPTAQLVAVRDRQLLPAKDLDNFFTNLVFDIEVLREILREYYVENKVEFTKNTTRQQKMVKDVTDIKAQLQELTAVAENKAVDYISESFTDTEYINFDNTTADVDLGYGQVILSKKPYLSRRVKLPNLKTYNPNIDIEGPTVEQVLSSGTHYGTAFANVVTDIDDIWIHRVSTADYTGSVTIIFMFPIEQKHVSRLVIQPNSDIPMTILPEVSEDGSFYEPLIAQQTRGNELQWRFEKRLIKTIKIRATIASPPYIRQGISDYVFGFRMIALFDDIYNNSGVMTTEYYEPDLQNTISAIELMAEEDIPDGCDIQYQIKAKEEGGATTGWMSLTPKSRATKENPSKIEISGTSHYWDSIPNDTPELVNSRDFVQFYDIGPVESNHDILMRTAKLYRGINAWEYLDGENIVTQTAETRIDLRMDKDAQMFFYKVENARYIADDTIAVSHQVDFNEAGQEMIVRKYDEINPTAAIASIIRKSFEEPIGFGTAGSGNKFFVEDFTEYPVLQPAGVTETVTVSTTDAYTIVARQSEDSYLADCKPEEDIIFLFSDGTSITFNLLLRSQLTFNDVEIEETGVLVPTTTDWSAQGMEDVFIKGDNDVLESLTNTSRVDVTIPIKAVSQIIFNSLKVTEQPENKGHESDSFHLIPNPKHVAQASDVFKVNDVDDLIVPFPVRITTDTFSGVYEVDRVSDYDADGTRRPILVITNPTKLGSTIPKATSYQVKSWEILSQDLTSEVKYIMGDKIKFKDSITIKDGDVIEVKYRVSAGSSKIDVMPETIKVIDSQTGATFREGVDFKYINGAIHSLKEDIVKDLFVVYKYQERKQSLHTVKTYLYTAQERVVQIKIASFGDSVYAPDKNAGETVAFDGSELRTGSVLTIKPGWHEVSIKAKDIDRLIKFIEATDTDGRRIFNVSDIFNRMLAIREPLSYVDHERLYRSSRLAGHQHFTIIDERVIVPFNPNDNAFINNRLYNIFKNEDLSAALSGSIISSPSLIEEKREEFEIEYDYNNNDTNVINSLHAEIQLKATLTRSLNYNSSLTPVLNNFTLRIY